MYHSHVYIYCSGGLGLAPRLGAVLRGNHGSKAE